MTLKFLVKRVFRIRISKMIKTARHLSKKTNLSTLHILKDMIHCAKKFGAGYNDYQEFEFYTLTDAQRKTFLTQSKNNEIIHTYNDSSKFEELNDKWLFAQNFKEFTKRNIFKLSEITYNDFITLLHNNEKIILKPIHGFGGEGILVYKTESFKKDTKQALKKLQDAYPNYLIEDHIVQHKTLSKIYPHSVNSLRIFTFFDGHTAHVINAVIKFGNHASVDNFSKGGMYAFIDTNGIITTPAIDQHDNTYTKHPKTKEPIYGAKIQGVNKACSCVIKAAERIPDIKYIGWDVAITDTDACILEANPYPGIFQKRPSFTKTKEGLLPSYGKYMSIFKEMT